MRGGSRMRVMRWRVRDDYIRATVKNPTEIKHPIICLFGICLRSVRRASSVVTAIIATAVINVSH
jgi:hypothetical protein